MTEQRDPSQEEPGREPTRPGTEPSVGPSTEPAPTEGRSDAGPHGPGEAGPAWDPWAPPTHPAPEAGPSIDSTQPVDLSHTQMIDPAPELAHRPSGQPAPGWTYDPQPADLHGRQQAPLGQHAQAPQDWFESHHALTQAAPPTRRGPGWGAVVAIAAACALMAGLVGGIAGGLLGASDRLDFARGDGPSSIPTVGRGATDRPEGSIANIAARALPSVVTIKVQGADGNGTGSGFVLDDRGHIITNNHVVAGAAEDGTIRVQLSNGSEIEATVAGRDASYDLAVLKTSRTDLQPLTMGSSSSVVVGDQVIAVGAPLGLDSTVTTGIVSALNRPVSPGGGGDEQAFINAIQTDAAINPGNSGGPLLDMNGHVIGVNSAIARVPGIPDSQSGNIGVGFSIPSDQVRTTAQQLIETGRAEHPVIGVILDRQFDGDGVKILTEAEGDQQPVSPGGPADRAGIKPGDVIIEFDGRRVTDPDDLVVAIRAKSVGDEVTMRVRRGDDEISVRMTLQGSEND